MVRNVWRKLRKRGSRVVSYNIKYKDDHLAHAGKKGMKWGYNDGQKNGKRTATEKFLDNMNREYQVMKNIDDHTNGEKDIVNRLYKEWYKNDNKKFRKRLKKHGLFDRYGTTLIKYGLNNIGVGRTEDKIEWRVASAKREAKKAINRAINGNKGQTKKKKESKIQFYTRDPRTGTFKRDKSTEKRLNERMKNQSKKKKKS